MTKNIFLRAVFKGQEKHNFAIKDNFQAFHSLFFTHDVMSNDNSTINLCFHTPTVTLI